MRDPAPTFAGVPQASGRGFEDAAPATMPLHQPLIIPDHDREVRSRSRP